jgi:hypothetical protein
MMRISGQDFVPVITIGEKVVTGFNEQQLVDLLQTHNP